MKKKNICILVLSVILSFGINSVKAIEVEDGWTLLEEGTATIEVDKLEEFEEKLSYRVNSLNKLNLDRVYRYRVETNDDNSLDDYLEISNDNAFDTEEEANEWAKNNEPEQDGWLFITNVVKSFSVDKVLDLIRFETKKEAEDEANNFINSVDEESADTTITEVRDETGDVTEKVENTYKFNTFEDASNASLKLIENTHDYIVSVNVYAGDPEYVETDTLTLNRVFDTKKEALDYITSLETAGYTVDYNIEEVNDLSTLDITYETREEAEAKLAEFLNTYPETTISNIEEVRDETGDTTVNVENDYKFNSKEEAENKALELEKDEYYYTVTVSVVEEEPEYVETITEDFTATFDNEEKALEFITSLETAGYTVDYNIEEVNKLSTLDEIYETSEEAEARLAKFLTDYPETTIYNIEELRDETGDTTVNVENTDKYYTFESAYNASLGLIENTHDYIVSVNVYKGDPELESTETLTLSEVFDTRDKATNFVTSLENAGYTVTSTIMEVTEISTLNETYNTYEEALTKLEEFKNTLKELTSSNITEVRDTEEDTVTNTTGTTEYTTYEDALEVANGLNENADKYQVVASVREGSKTVVTGPTDVESDQFDTYEAALAYIAELENNGYDVSNLKIELVPYEESIWGDDEDVEVDPGEDDDTKFTYNHFDVTLITSFTKIDTLGNKTTVTGTIAISDVKIAGKDITMEGPSTDPNEGYTEYTSKERHKLSVTEESLVEISGTVTYTDPETKKEKTLPFTVSGYLSEDQNVCGGKDGAKGYDLKFESVTIINNKVVIDTNIISKYKVTGTMTKTEVIPVYYVDTTKTTYGYDYNVNTSGIELTGYQVVGSAVKNTYKDVYLLDIKKTTKDYDYRVTANGVKFIEYLVTGTKSLDIYQDVYTLDVFKTTKDYDYRVTADGVKFIEYEVTGTASKDIYQDIYLLDINKTILDYDYEVSGTGIKTYYDIISKYVRLINVDYIIEYMELGKGGDVEVLPPQTGVTNNNSLINIVATLILGLIVVIRSFI